MSTNLINVPHHIETIFCSANQLAGFYMMGNIDHNIEIVNDQYLALMQLVGSIKNATRLTNSEGKIFSKCSYEEY